MRLALGFLLLFAPLSLHADLSPTSSVALSPTVKAKAGMQAWDEHQSVRLKGDRLEYFQDGKVLRGEGHVELESGTLRMKADHIVLDLNSNSLEARGGVIWADSGNTVYAEKVSLDMKTQKGRAENLLFRRGNWVAAGGLAQKSSDKDLSLQECEASSCLAENPHYRLVASSIDAELGERITAHNVLIYVGVAPLFYLPYYTQSLKDPRPPFEIRPGYDRINGAYVRMAYNYYLNEALWGSLRLDWMDLGGMGYGLAQHYKLLGGEGQFSGYYTHDKSDDGSQWTGNISHNEDFGHGLKLLANADFISEYQVNENYNINAVDNFQNRKYLSLQSSQKDYSWALNFSDTQQLQQNPVDLSNTSDRQYVTTERSLPSFSFNRYSKPLWVGKALYYGISGSYTQSLIVPLTVTAVSAGGSSTVTAGTSYYEEALAYTSTNATLSPSLSYTQRLIKGLALSSNLSYNQAYTRLSNQPGQGQGVSSGNAVLNLHFPGRYLNADLGYRNARQFSQMDTLRFAGLTEDRLTLSSTLTLSEAASILNSTDYNLLPFGVPSDLQRLGLIRSQGLYAPSTSMSYTLVTTYHAPTGQLKTLDANFNVNDPKKRWETGGGWSWVNNRIIQVPESMDPNAPLTYAFEEPRRSPDQALVNWRASMVLTPHWSVSGYQRLDLASKSIVEQAFSVLRDLHCWNLELYGRDRSTTGWQFGFTLTLKALPQVSASSNKIVSDLFDDVSYGY